MAKFLTKYCTEEWCEFVSHYSSKISYKPNDYIIKTGEETLGIYAIEEGKVKITTNSGQGQERIIRLASNGDLLGHRGFGGNWKYTISAIALEETSVFFIPLKIFNYAVKANPELGFYMMMFFAEELRESERMASQMPIKNIIANVIYQNYLSFGFDLIDRKKLSYTLSRKDIASFAGTRYETVVRTLAELQKEEVLILEGKALKISNLSKLKQLAEGY